MCRALDIADRTQAVVSRAYLESVYGDEWTRRSFLTGPTRWTC
jgi:hypothetical protein